MSAPLCIYYRLYDLKKSVQLIVAYPPPLAEQKRIVEQISTVYKQLDLISNALR